MDILTVSWLSLLRLNSPRSLSILSQIALSMHMCGHHHCWGGIKGSVAFLGLEVVLVCYPSCFYCTYKPYGSAHYLPFQHSNCCLPPSHSPAAASLPGCHHSPAWAYFVSDHCGCVHSCQLVAPLSRTKKPEQSSAAVMVSYWFCSVLPKYTCTHPDCF